MLKNSEGGRKNTALDLRRNLIFKEDGQEYAQVLHITGNERCEAMCIDGTKRLCHLSGEKVLIAAGDIILVGLRDCQGDNADFILKYMYDEAMLLKAYGELPANTRLNRVIDKAADDYDKFDDEYLAEFKDEDIGEFEDEDIGRI